MKARIDLGAEFAAIIDRIHTACLTVTTLPPDGPKGPYSLWPSYRHSWWDEGNEISKLSAADITRRLISPPEFVATPRQIDDCLPALALLDGEEALTRRVVALRALQLWYGKHAAADDERWAHLRGGWRGIGDLVGLAHKNARRRHREAMLRALDRVVGMAT